MSISLQLADGTVTTDRVPALIGRALEADIKVPEWHGSVSRKHARIYVSAGRYYIEDLGSSNGTKVDGIGIMGPTPLTSSCRLSLGELEAFLTLTPIQPAASGTAGWSTVVVPNPLVPPASPPPPAVPVAYPPPVQRYTPPARKSPRSPSPQPQPSAPPMPARRPSVAIPASTDDSAQLRLHRYLGWSAVGLVFLSFTMPWVKAGAFGVTLQLNYFRMIRELARASDVAGQAGLELQTTAVFLPLLAFVLMVAAGVLSHALPLKQSAVGSIVGGAVGVLTGYGIYSYASSGIGIDVSGALAGGFKLFCFAAVGLLVEGVLMNFMLKPKQAQ